MDAQDKRIDSVEKIIHKMGIDIQAIRADVRLITEGHVMLAEKFGRFEAEYIRHAVDTRQDILNLYKMTYGQLEGRVKELETAKRYMARTSQDIIAMRTGRAIRQPRSLA